MKTIFISDLDGTLLTPNVDLTKFTSHTINSLAEKGMIFTFATARSFSSAKKLLGDLKLNFPVIIYNGVAIHDPITGNLIAKNTFSQNDSEKIFEIMSAYDYSPIVYSFVNDKERVSWLETNKSGGIAKYVASRKDDQRMRKCNFSKQLMDGEIYYFTCIDEREKLLPIYEKIKGLDCCNVFFQKELYDDYFWLEIMSKNASKGNAIMELKKHLGCEKIVAFGDSVNDIPMFKIADECYAMANATDELKKIATEVIGSNQKDGVAHWLAQNFY